jgi:DNA mismatch repair protein MutS2
MLRLTTQTDEKLAELFNTYNDKFNEFEKQRKEILRKAKEQAVTIIDGANQVIEKTIREIKEVKADTHKTKEIRGKVSAYKENLKKDNLLEEDNLLNLQLPIIPSLKSNKVEIKETPIVVGDSVFIADIETVGEVTQLNGNDVTVSFNSISFKTSLSKLTKISRKEARQVHRSGVARLDGTRIGEVMNEKISKFKFEIDLRGKRADETIQLLEPYIDEAIVLGIKQVKILHGKGNGTLRHVIRQWLAKRKEVSQYYDEAIELGGCGITIVDMK